jgi:hypothetical protein
MWNVEGKYIFHRCRRLRSCSRSRRWRAKWSMLSSFRSPSENAIKDQIKVSVSRTSSPENIHVYTHTPSESGGKIVTYWENRGIAGLKITQPLNFRGNHAKHFSSTTLGWWPKGRKCLNVSLHSPLHSKTQAHGKVQLCKKNVFFCIWLLCSFLRKTAGVAMIKWRY